MTLLTRKEAARFLRISLRKLDALASQGRLRFSKLGPGKRARVVYRQEDLDEFVRQHLSVTEDDLRRQTRQILRRNA